MDYFGTSSKHVSETELIIVMAFGAGSDVTPNHNVLLCLSDLRAQILPWTHKQLLFANRIFMVQLPQLTIVGVN